MNKQDIMLAIMNVEEFPTLPQVISKVIEICGNSESTVDDLAKVVSRDQSIASRILKLANSAYYGYLRKVNTIPKAVNILGFDTIRSLAISASVFDTFKKIRSNYNFDRCQFWIHSIGVGTISKLIARQINKVDVEVAFLNGLLHDVGKLFFESFYPTQFEDIMKEVTVNRCSIYEAEQKVFGITHSEVGGLLTDRWKFPPELVYPIEFHHDLEQCPPQYLMLAAIVSVADSICRRHNIGSGGDCILPEINPLAASILSLNQSNIDQLIEQTSGERENIFTFMAIMD